MSYYTRRGFNKDLLPKITPKQGKWVKRRSKGDGERRPFNIWFQKTLTKLNMSVEEFAKEINELNKIDNQPRTEETVVKYWTKDTIPRSRLQNKLANVIANNSNQSLQEVTKQLISVIEDETIFQEEVMNITQEANQIQSQHKRTNMIETLEIHKHNERLNLKDKEVGSFFVRTKHRKVYMDDELQLYYKESGNKYIINFKYVLPVNQEELNFLMEITRFKVITQTYIQKHIDKNFDPRSHFSITNGWIHIAPISIGKIYVTTKARNITEQALLWPDLLPKSNYDRLNDYQKKAYKLKVFKEFSKRTENKNDYNKTYAWIGFI